MTEYWREQMGLESILARMEREHAEERAENAKVGPWDWMEIQVASKWTRKRVYAEVKEWLDRRDNGTLYG